MPPPATSCVIVDAQQGLLEGANAVPDAVGVLARLATLLASARAAGAQVVYLQNDSAPDSLDEPGAPGWPIHPHLVPQAGELVLRKTGDDGFDGTPLEAVLAHAGVKRVAIAGLLSEMCVSATIRGAFARGLQVVLVRDAHATYDLEDIPASVVSRVAEHALGDTLELAGAQSIRFERP